MGVVQMVAIFSFIGYFLIDKTDANNMSLSSSPATVGQPVSLRCVYTGSYTPAIINFYLGTDTQGLQIEVPACSIWALNNYNITLFDRTCGSREVNLTIKSVTKADIGTTWHCDALFSVSPPFLPAKASTTIQETSSPANSSSNPPSSKEIAIGVSLGLVFVCHVVLIVVIILKSDLSKQALIVIAIASILLVAVEVLIIYLIKKKKFGPSQSADKTMKTKEPSDQDAGAKTNQLHEMPQKQKPAGRLSPLTNRNGNKPGQ